MSSIKRNIVVGLLVAAVLTGVLTLLFLGSDDHRELSAILLERRIDDTDALFGWKKKSTVQTLVREIGCRSTSLGTNTLVIVGIDAEVQIRELLAGCDKYLPQLVASCNTQGSQLCFYQIKDGLTPLSKASIVSWRSPFHHPRSGEHTSYWFDSRYLGMGEAGLSNMLARCATTTADLVLFARSRYETGGSWGPDELPFAEASLNVAIAGMRVRGITVVWLKCHDFDIFPALVRDIH